ncbi:type II toxin-antitoxin system VapB family antitoxin [Streptomyces sp. ISL-43]|uniref:type II toxin-antitoxin system VapB family antitoxin n=1 Tax=Streptomyces sp. ISL-43 TaxID=2819183 RepID=UPI001BECC643|nr:type II toxin-antitoxin system VapB family antitoxin [Streptomyces sp. ISL-43]MBT2447574.1 type II toxin-antitoxin system VapB family antitoxin [Streptomyces sp. ISL-43]
MSGEYIEVDDEALAAAAEILRTTSPEATVNAALRAFIEQHRQPLADPESGQS